MPVYKKVNKDFFKKWSPEMAYVLGFFSADGYVTKNNRGAEFLCLEISDKKLINTIKTVLKSEHKISVRKKFDKITYRLQIGSIEMCNDLRILGIKERKTKNLSLPKVPSEYIKDFVRGYFDGDGNVWVGYIHKDRKKSMLAVRLVLTSCSKDFLSSLGNKLLEFGIQNGVVRKGEGNYYRLTYSIINSLKLYDFMYNNLGTSKLFLKRKKDVFEKFIKMRP
ncbi:MAG: LAGLIDADG family homing endonuclease [Parcubacteria group bacterium]